MKRRRERQPEPDDENVARWKALVLELTRILRETQRALLNRFPHGSAVGMPERREEEREAKLCAWRDAHAMLAEGWEAAAAVADQLAGKACAVPAPPAVLKVKRYRTTQARCEAAARAGGRVRADMSSLIPLADKLDRLFVKAAALPGGTPARTAAVKEARAAARAFSFRLRRAAASACLAGREAAA